MKRSRFLGLVAGVPARDEKTPSDEFAEAATAAVARAAKTLATEVIPTFSYLSGKFS